MTCLGAVDEAREHRVSLGTAYFSKLDLKEGYHQFEIHDTSWVITTFFTH